MFHFVESLRLYACFYYLSLCVPTCALRGEEREIEIERDGIDDI